MTVRSNTQTPIESGGNLSVFQCPPSSSNEASPPTLHSILKVTPWRVLLALATYVCDIIKHIMQAAHGERNWAHTPAHLIEVKIVFDAQGDEMRQYFSSQLLFGDPQLFMSKSTFINTWEKNSISFRKEHTKFVETMKILYLQQVFLDTGVAFLLRVGTPLSCGPQWLPLYSQPRRVTPWVIRPVPFWFNDNPNLKAQSLWPSSEVLGHP